MTRNCGIVMVSDLRNHLEVAALSLMIITRFPLLVQIPHKLFIFEPDNHQAKKTRDPSNPAMTAIFILKPGADDRLLKALSGLIFHVPIYYRFWPNLTGSWRS